MGRSPCCDKDNVKRGPWSPEEDTKLKSYIERYGTVGNWIALPQNIGLKRCGKSCRLRWLNYLRPNIKHGGFSDQEDNIICSLYMSIGSRWSIIAAQLPGRTDNDIKNYWNTKLKKKLLKKEQQQARRATSFVKQEMKMQNYDHDKSNYTMMITNHNDEAMVTTPQNNLGMPTTTTFSHDHEEPSFEEEEKLLIKNGGNSSNQQFDYNQLQQYNNTFSTPIINDMYDHDDHVLHGLSELDEFLSYDMNMNQLGSNADANNANPLEMNNMNMLLNYQDIFEALQSLICQEDKVV